MRVNPRKYGRDREALLGPLALRHKLNYVHEVLAPGSRPPEVAFHLVGCGADLLSGLRYPDAIPTTNRKIAKSAAKMVAQGFREEEGRRASVFLAQAFATWYVEMMSRDGDPRSAAAHQSLRELIQHFFPLDALDIDELESLRAEYRVMDDHNIAGRIPATGYHMALLDPEFAEGRDVDTDPELTEVQLRYASRYLRLGAERRAIAICAGEKAFASLQGELFYAAWPGYEILEYDIGSLKWWTHYVPDWQRIGQLALSAEN